MDQLNFNDIFKSSFLDKATSISIVDITLSMALALAAGLFIMAVYRKTFRGVMYSRSFNVSLLALTLVTTLIILAITSNVVLSLGMVGALSIVRFRSAIKDPLDIAYLFWSIAVGIVIGAGFISLAVIGSIFIGIIMTLFINRENHDQPYILVINCENDVSEKSAMEMISTAVKKHIVKSKSVADGAIELTVEIRLKDMASQFINELSALPGITNAVMVSYNGDYMG